MKVIFLDFDGVLNSVQESVGKNNRRKRSFYWGKREAFANWLCGLGWKKEKIDNRWVYTSSGRRKDPFGIFRFLSDVSREHIADHGEFSEASCALVQYLMDNDEDTRVVVSSTWRMGGLKYMKQIAKRNYMDPDKFIDITPGGHEGPNGEDWLNLDKDITMNVTTETPKLGRGTQIQKWLNHNKHLNVTHFAIIDDDSDMCHLMHRFVKTDGYVGFCWRDMVKVAKLLEIKDKHGRPL